VAIEPPLTSRPALSSGKPARSANQRTTWCSMWTAAWLPPATLGFIAAASASAKTPRRWGGEFTQAKNRG
jgi:hypothetical protein